MAIQIGLGRFFAWKLRSSVFYAVHLKTGQCAALDEALGTYRKARAAWAEMAEQARGVYVKNIAFGPEANLRGHWLDRLAAIDQDIADMEKVPSGSQSQRFTQAPGHTLPGDGRGLGRARPRSPGAPESSLAALPPRAAGHVPPGRAADNRAIARRDRRGVAAGRGFAPLPARQPGRELPRGEHAIPAARYIAAVIPADYTNSPYPLEYFFVCRDAKNRAWLHPGFREEPLQSTVLRGSPGVRRRDSIGGRGCACRAAWCEAAARVQPS